MLLAPVVPTLAPENFCLRIPELQEENVVEHHHELTINESKPVGSYIETVMEVRSVGNLCKQPQSGVV
jgi:hypothetical protein